MASTRHQNILTRTATGLLVIDVQEKYVPAIPDMDAIIENIVRLIITAQMYEMPVLVTEQYPKGLGPTVRLIKRLFPHWNPLEKMALSCLQDQGFCAELEKLDLKSIIVCGIEAHVCVNQTVLDLLETGMQVHVVTDAIGSRHLSDYETAIKKMMQAGAVPSTTEMALFELTEKAGTPEFKNIQRMVKSKLKQPSQLMTDTTIAPQAAAGHPSQSVSAAPSANVHEVNENGIDESPAMFEEKSDPTIKTEQKAVVDAAKAKPAPAVNNKPVSDGTEVIAKTEPAGNPPSAPGRNKAIDASPAMFEEKSDPAKKTEQKAVVDAAKANPAPAAKNKPVSDGTEIIAKTEPAGNLPSVPGRNKTIDKSPAMFEEKSDPAKKTEQKAVVDAAKAKPAPATKNKPVSDGTEIIVKTEPAGNPPSVPDQNKVTVIEPGQKVSVPAPKKIPGAVRKYEELSDKPLKIEAAKKDAGVDDHPADAGDILGSAAGELPEADAVELNSIIAAEKKQGSHAAPEKQKAIADDTDVFDPASIKDGTKQKRDKRT